MVSKTGGCLCGAVTYEMSMEPVVNGICNCKNCQKQAGSAFSTISGVPKAAIEVKGDALKTYRDSDTDNGGTVERFFCGECGSPIYSVTPGQPDLVFLKSGTLDDTSGWVPQFNLWCSTKQDWVVSPEGVPSMDKQ